MSRAQVEAQLLALARRARRMQHWDHLARPNPEWAKLHRRIDVLLHRWQDLVAEERAAAV